jgi:serine-protein kinase ATM
MLQVFQQMDGVMRRNRETRRRKMRIRTYSVVPLDPQSGLIEWVLNTIPLLDFLKKSHSAVYPKDWRPSVCDTKINDAMGWSAKKRYDVYVEVCAHFKPVLRYFFLGNFKDPDSWLEKRTNYSRGLAASSMIGYVLGLGDRHGGNILLDQGSGEVMHIDLGIAFEQV